jgi:hypothetical protein
MNSMDRHHPAGGRRRWAIGAMVGFALVSLAGAGGATAATDRTRPVVHAPIVSLRVGSGVGSNAPVRIDFLATDTGTGVPTGYGSTIAISRNGGPYANLTWTGGMFTGGVVPYPVGAGSKWISAYRTFQLSGTYRVRVRARDLAGNWSPWVYGPTIRARMIQENSSIFAHSAGWTRASGPWLGGYAESSGTAGATVTGTFSASSIAWVARRAPGYGTAEVWIDGVLAAGTVILNNSNPWVTGRLVVFSKTWTHTGTHSISIKVLGTGLVEFDGLLELR